MFGGPIAVDRLWFFGAGRWEDVTNATRVPANRHRQHADRQESSRRDQADGHGRVGADGAGRLCEQSHGDAEPAVHPVVQHRSVHERPGQPAELVLLHELQGRREPDVARRSGIFPARVDARRGRHEHRRARIAVPEPGRQCSVQRAVLRRERSGRQKQSSAHRQPLVRVPGGRAARPQERVRMVPKPADRRRLADGDQSGLPRRLRGRSGRQAGLRFDQPSDAGVHAGRVARRGVLTASERGAEHRHAVALRAGSLGHQPAMGRGPRRALRARPQRGHGRHCRRQHRDHRAAARELVRSEGQRPIRRARHLRPLRRPLQRESDRRQHERGNRERNHRRLRRTGRAGSKLCARVRCQQLPHGGGRVPDRQRDARGGAFDAGGEGIHRLARRGRRVARLGVRHLCLPAHRESHRRLHLDRQRHDPRRLRTATISGRSPTSCTRTAMSRGGATRVSSSRVCIAFAGTGASTGTTP